MLKMVPTKSNQLVSAIWTTLSATTMNSALQCLSPTSYSTDRKPNSRNFSPRPHSIAQWCPQGWHHLLHLHSNLMMSRKKRSLWGAIQMKTSSKNASKSSKTQLWASNAQSAFEWSPRKKIAARKIIKELSSKRRRKSSGVHRQIPSLLILKPTSWIARRRRVGVKSKKIATKGVSLLPKATNV